MTREREDRRCGTREELAIERRLWAGYKITHPDTPDMGEIFDAIEAAWDARIEDSASYRAELARLREQIESLEKERDAAIEEGLALTVEKDGMQVEIDQLKRDIEAYCGALGDAVPGDHDGRLADGTLPINSIAEAQVRKIATLTTKIQKLEEEVDRLKKKIDTLGGTWL